MPLPYRIDDGNFGVAQQNGTGTISYPFANVGDNVSFVWRIPMRVDAEAFTPTAAMTPRVFPQGTAYLVDIEQSSVPGAALLEYNEVYASIPVTRREYGSVSYTTNSLSVVDPSFSYQFTQLVDATYIYEYSANTPLPALFRPYYDPGFAFYVKGSTDSFGNEVPPLEDGSLLADNSSTKIYAGKIYERLSVYAAQVPNANAGAIVIG